MAFSSRLALQLKYILSLVADIFNVRIAESKGRYCTSTGLLAGSSIYPEIRTRSNLPMVARMLLHGDGSTTLLLRQITGSKIFADVLPSRIVDAREAKIFRGVLQGSEESALKVRHTRLRAAAGEIVSENFITYRERDESLLIPPPGMPFGIHTRQLGIFERRRILLIGVTCKPFGYFPAAAPARIYEIEFSNHSTVLVHEVFNPAVIRTRDVKLRRPEPNATARPPRTLNASTSLCYMEYRS
ncbi:hypothetical protein [Nocardia sp. NPDC004750]